MSPTSDNDKRKASARQGRPLTDYALMVVVIVVVAAVGVLVRESMDPMQPGATPTPSIAAPADPPPS